MKRILLMLATTAICMLATATVFAESTGTEVKKAESLDSEKDTVYSEETENVTSKVNGSEAPESGEADPVSKVVGFDYKYLGLNEDDLSAENLIGVDTDLRVEDIDEKLSSKLGSIAQLFKTVGRWVCFLSFTCCCILCVVSAFSRNPLLVKGIIGALISGICYTAITYGEYIMAMMANFWAS